MRGVEGFHFVVARMLDEASFSLRYLKSLFKTATHDNIFDIMAKPFIKHHDGHHHHCHITITRFSGHITITRIVTRSDSAGDQRNTNGSRHQRGSPALMFNYVSHEELEAQEKVRKKSGACL